MVSSTALDPVRACTLTISGMKGQTCAQGIESDLSRKPGVIRASVDASAGRGRFEYDPSETAPDLIREFVEDLGFGASFDAVATTTKEAIRQCTVEVIRLILNTKYVFVMLSRLICLSPQ